MNARKEFLSHAAGKEVKCVTIGRGAYGYHTVYNLKEGHTQEEFDSFIESLDFDYDSGYGGQVLFGYIWYTDGTWSDRGEYDGSEWWQHHKCPEISYFEVDTSVIVQLQREMEEYFDTHLNHYPDHPEDNHLEIVPSDDPEYIIASTYYRDGSEETYIFEANLAGERTTSYEYGGLAKRWGDDNWNNRDAAVKLVMNKPYKYLSTTVNGDCIQDLYVRDKQGE